MTTFGLTDFDWAILANDAYRRYELRGGEPEEGYISNPTLAQIQLVNPNVKMLHQKQYKPLIGVDMLTQLARLFCLMVGRSLFTIKALLPIFLTMQFLT